MYNSVYDEVEVRPLKRVLCVLLALMLPCAALAEYVMAGYDPDSTYRVWSENKFFARMEERTGIAFTYRQYGKTADWQAAKAAMRAGDETLPDVLFKAELSPAECIELLDAGVLVDIKPYIATCCPALFALLEANPAYWQAITLPDGRVAALPYISEQPIQNCVWLNSVWMDRLNLTMPSDVEEFTALLRAFRDGDPNQNGRADEIPLAFIGSFDLKFLGHAFGLVANDYNVYEKDGAVCFLPLDEQFRPFVEWLRLLYSEGLLDKDGFTTSDNFRAVEKSTDTNKFGGAITTMVSNFLPAEWIGDYAVMPPLVFNGERTYRSFNGAVLTGTFAVTTACEDVARVLGWVDTFYTEEVSVLASIGQQNTDYVIDGDGTWRILDAAGANTYFTGETLLSTGGSAPGISSDAFQRRYSDSAVRYVSEEIEKINNVARLPFPYYALTRAQEAEVAPLQSKLGRYVDESIARWVLGEEDLTDESFARFETTLYEYGLGAFMAFWQDVLDGGLH